MTATTRRRATPVLTAALVAASAVAACAPAGEVTCSDIGWSNSLEVELEGERAAVDDVALVRVCVGADCTSADGANPPEPSRLEVPTTTLTGTDAGGGRWDLGPVFSGSEDTYVVWTYAEDGSLLHAVSVVPEWQRVGGSEACGGPHLGTATVNV
jgi:hypothetical protein